MGGRIDYHDDPDAPAANSIRPSASTFVRRDDRVLLIQRSDNGNWSMPGGAQDPGESLTATAVRETREETGIDIEITGISGVYTDPRHVVHYTSDDEVRQEFTVVYAADYVDGKPAVSPESTRVEWVDLDDLDSLPMHPSQRRRIDWAVAGGATYFDPVGVDSNHHRH